ncbi:MAG: hypothetical protein KKH98_13535 [Spirochaetes bacterium]|nr:hypothetical protein [Spirochaetota bacterium]
MRRAMKLFSVLFAVLAVLSFSSCSGAKEQVRDDDYKFGDEKDMGGLGSKMVTAEGLAEVREAGLADAYDRAEEAAKTKAIEKALGIIIDARILGSSGVILEENIYAKKQGYIRKSEIVSKNEKDGIAYVTVKAEVGMQKLKDDVMALDILQHRMNMPKTIIIIDEKIAGKQSSQNISYSVIADKFTEKKFTIISPSEISKEYKNKMKQLYGSVDGDENVFVSIAAGIGLDVNADVVIAGTAYAGEAKKLKGTEGTAFLSSQGNIHLKVINVGDGRIIASKFQRSSGAHVESDEAGLSACKRGAELAGDALIDQVLKAWEDILNNGNLITLYVSGLSLTEEVKFEKLLKAYYREVKEVYGKQKKSGKSVFSVKFLGTPRDLAKALVTKSTFPYKVDVTKYDFGEVTIKAERKK